MDNNKNRLKVFYFTPIIQFLFIALHNRLDPNDTRFIVNLFCIVLSVMFASISVYFVMKLNKHNQYDVFLSDSLAENRMIEKIGEKTTRTRSFTWKKFSKNTNSNKLKDETLEYDSFLNLYFSCFSKQPKQILYLFLNWGSSLIVLVSMIKPLTDNELMQGQLGLLMMFIFIFVLLFSIITYFYSTYLKAKMETKIIEDYIVHQKR